MRRASTVVAMISIALAWPSHAVLGGLVVDSWSVGATVHDWAADDFNTVFNQVVQNPFQTVHSAMFGSSTATVNYDFAWSGDSGHFDLGAIHHLEELEGDTSSSGYVFVVPAVDSNVSFSGSWRFAWPSATRGSTSLHLAIVDAQTEEFVADEVAFGGNVGLGPPFGTLNVQGGATLLATRGYFVQYTVFIDHFDPTPPGTYGEGVGEIHFSMTPVPEPAALALILPALFFPRRRKR